MRDLRWLAFDRNGPVQSHYDRLDQYFNVLVDLPHGTLIKHIKKCCQLPVANMVDQWAHSRTLISMNSSAQCGICNKVFKSHQSKTLHEFKAHGIKDPIRCYAPSSVCVCCMKNFWTRPRIVNHLKKSRFCRLNLQMKYAPFITSEECNRLEAIEHPDLKVLIAGGKRLHYANRAPCTRMPGPLVHNIPIN